ncbi:receptor-like protein kinase FERONIA [Coffea arabica]|uniref:Receptor-like protein kinase FERONIA n=1 Tax=Coffea arabica TaxID=13443 RepID=A0A6P6T4S1_COFAR|nr:receptor-like protein kinase FERONIA [Coffea arabica]
MLVSKLSFLFLFLLHFYFTTISASHIPVLDNLAISSGSSGILTASNGRVWVGDTGSKSSTLLQLSGKSTKSRVNHHPAASVDAVPYLTARISHHHFTYTFPVKPGQKIIRLHFNPVSYKNFKKSRAFFSVKAGPYTLLSNFNGSLAAGASGAGHFTREFCVNIEEDELLSITFSPDQGNEGSSDDRYAFVNGIEIVCMPAGLYFTPDDGLGPFVVGQKYRFFIDNSTALEMIQRLNIGGNSIASVEDGGMFRSWDEDLNHLPQNGSLVIKRVIPIKYTRAPSYIAPKKVYQTARSMVPHTNLRRRNLMWKIPVDLGFRYLIRLHFSELELGITQCGEREFRIIINNQVAEDNADVIKWGAEHGVAVYRDYVVLMEGDRMEGKRYLNITFQPKLVLSGKETDGILNGMEIFKLSNPDNNLASMRTIEFVRSSRSQKQEDKKILSFGRKNAVATALTVIITLLNVTVYYIRRLSETSARNLRSSSSEKFCRLFSIHEIRSATNDFSHEFLIGSGGYGRVYKGSIDGGATTVAIKRLKSESRQGEKEFWTEIKMLSRLRHEHLVPLIGYCNEGQEMILVYEYMPKGTVADHLYKIGRHGGCAPPLSWEQRLKICIGAARGLYFLHTSRQRVIHRDVKSSNILLDENWVAKISDFGLSKMGAPNESITHMSTNVKGTFGYLDPEYFLTRKLTRKSDVYAFGVVLFEVLSGRPAVDLRLEEEQHSLAAWARYCIRKGKVDNLIDRNLIGQISPACLKVFVGIAGRCVDTHPHERPAMADVVIPLELALVLQQSPGSTEQAEEDDDINNVARSSSEQSDGVFSLDELSVNPSNGGMEQNVSKELSGAAPGTKETYVLKNSKKDNSSNNATSSRWWWDPFGLVPRSPSKTKASALHEGLRQFHIQEIRKATNNFQNSFIVGFGGLDSVYKGLVDDIPRIVAVRRSSSRESRLSMARELQSKMEMVPSLRHAHVVTLIGYCNDEPELMLVYEYMANGSLHDHLCDPNKDPLPWKRRLQICIGAARGLSHLQSTVKLTNLHRNLKSTNILLDENWVAKVSDFGLSRRRGVSGAHTIVRGDLGSLDSDYILDDRLTEKSYVFSFGLLLFEVLCATKESTHWLDEDHVSLAQWIKSGIRNNLSGSNIDPYLAGKIAPECCRIFAETAIKCLLDKGSERPSMNDIVASLEAALKLQEASDNDEGV